MERTIRIDKYYSSLQNMLKKYDKYARKDYFQGTTVAEFEDFKKKTRDLLFGLLGMEKMDYVPLNARVEERREVESGIIREKVVIQTEEDVWMPMYILIPTAGNPWEKEVFLAPPGHQGAGKYSVAGCYEIPAVMDKITFFQYDYGMQLARQGYVAVCPDCRGFGERREEKMQGDEEDKFIGCSCYHLTHMAEPLGETAIGMLTWDIMRLIDYLYERNEWKLSTLGCLGFSGGGMQTLYAAAMDERIKRVVISGYMYGFRDSLLILNGNCNCNYVPHLWEHLDCGDIGSLIAPRPFVIQSCRDDHLNGPRGLVNVYEQVETIKNAYALYGKEENIYHDICEGGHSWHNEKMQMILDFLKNKSM